MRLCPAADERTIIACAAPTAACPSSASIGCADGLAFFPRLLGARQPAHPLPAALLPGRFTLLWRTRGALVRLRERSRRFRLRSLLDLNPHDRRARHELASLALRVGRAQEALELLKPNIAAGDHDWETLILMGRACFGAGFPAQAEVFLAEAKADEPARSMGEVDLELGRGLLDAGDARRALEALERLCLERPGTVEGRVLCARAQAKLGDRTAARALREQAFAQWRSAPRFVRRRDRAWAFRVQPAPFLAKGLLLFGGCVALAAFVPGLLLRGQSPGELSRPAEEPFAGAAVLLPPAEPAPTFLPVPLDVEVPSAEVARLNYQLAALLDARLLLV